jgi:NAD(P)-dependent dehydrogenase (short-subunit alcohol dehydrogenase family)
VQKRRVRPTARRVFVTGGGSGIGRAVAIRFAREGAAVAVTDVRSDATAVVAEEIRSNDGRATAHACDVTDESSVERVVGEVAGEFGGLDTVVACAGIAHPAATHEMSLASWETMLRVNLTGVFLTLKHALPHLVSAADWRPSPVTAAHRPTVSRSRCPDAPTPTRSPQRWRSCARTTRRRCPGSRTRSTVATARSDHEEEAS